MLHRLQVGPAARRALAVAVLSLATSQGLHAAGFALIEQGVSGMGTAYAGAAASADSVDTLFFNPAGMTRLPGTQGGAAVHLVLPQSHFKNEGTTFVTGDPIDGGDGGDAGSLAALPHVYLTSQINDRAWLGLAINVPFGLTTEYDDDWVGRYHAIKSHVLTLNINPSLAFKANDRVSLAVGVSAMYLNGEFSNAIDFGLLNVLNDPTNPLYGWDGGLAGRKPGEADGRLVIDGDSWGFGFNLGALFELSEETRIGVHYRSEVAQRIEGHAKFTLPDNPGDLRYAFTDTKVEADVDLPATASISAFHQVNSEWAIMADYTWTGWSSIPELRFDFANSLPDGVTTFEWDDTDRFSLGATFKPASVGWTYRFGVAYDESPVADAASRSARLPDADRIWLAIGAGFEPSKNLKVDIGYAHLFMDDPEIAKTGLVPEDTTRGALNGRYDSKIDILSIEARYVF